MQKPTNAEYHSFYDTYINADNFPKGDLIELLQSVHSAHQNLLASLTEEQGNYRYAPEKWTIKQLVQHVIDAERVMAYRAMCIVRMDQTALPGYDENNYASAARVDHLTLEGLAAQWLRLRQTSIDLFTGFSEEESKRMGNANGAAISVRALAYIILGHELHHIRILKERYL